MSVRVELAAKAREQIRAAGAWWAANRPSAPDLFDAELAVALDMLARTPLLAQVFDEIEGKTVRKVRLPRIRYALFFTVDGDIVTVHALWHGARGSGPPLP